MRCFFMCGIFYMQMVIRPFTRKLSLNFHYYCFCANMRNKYFYNTHGLFLTYFFLYRKILVYAILNRIKKATWNEYSAYIKGRIYLYIIFITFPNIFGRYLNILDNDIIDY